MRPGPRRSKSQSTIWLSGADLVATALDDLASVLGAIKERFGVEG